MLKSKAIQWAFSALCVVTFASSIVKAQSTLFNIPSTDVVATKKVYVEFDFISHLESHREGGFQAYVPRVVVGVAKNLEAGANVAFSIRWLPISQWSCSPIVKYQFYNSEGHGVACSSGGHSLYADC
jgi:hypothetical protein